MVPSFLLSYPDFHARSALVSGIVSSYPFPFFSFDYLFITTVRIIYHEIKINTGRSALPGNNKILPFDLVLLKIPLQALLPSRS